ncbi:MAG: extracellular solute-binding protein [Spirochaetaceae bacterium]|nr:MAG: extracellular solute-binding protein [Spirochaetaceae bacterium]
MYCNHTRTTRGVAIVALALLLVGATTAFAGGAAQQPAAAVDFNATGFPITNQPTTLKVFFGLLPEQTVPLNRMTIVRQIQERTNVEIDWVTAPANDMDTRINLMFASGDLPDMFLEGLSVPQAFAYAAQGLVRPIDELLEQYAPTITGFIDTTPGLREVLTSPDGRIYSTFNFGNAYHQDLGNMLYINREWLAAVGREIPTTLDEYYEILQLFKSRDLNGTGSAADQIPLSLVFYTRNVNWSDLGFFGSFGVQMDQGADFFAVENDRVVWEPATEGFKNTIAWLNKLHREGLLDPEAYIQDRGQMQAKGNQVPPIFGSYVSWFSINVAGQNGRFYDIVGPLEGPDGHRMANWHPRAMMNGGRGVIPTSSNKAEIAIRWLDHIYEPEINIQMAYGAFGEGVEKTADGTYRILPPPEGVSAELHRMTASPHHPPMTFPQVLTTEDPQHFQDKDRAKRELFLPYLPVDRALPVFYLTQADQEQFDAIFPDLLSYMQQKWAEWVTNGRIDQEWAEYLRRLDQMGLPQAIAIQQRGLDNLRSR